MTGAGFTCESPILAKSLFAILPLGVMGIIGIMKIRVGRLYDARCFAEYSANSATVTCDPGEGWTKAKISSLPWVVLPITADCATPGWPFKTDSTSAG